MATWRSVTNGRKRLMLYDNEGKITQNHDLAEHHEPTNTIICVFIEEEVVLLFVLQGSGVSQRTLGLTRWVMSQRIAGCVFESDCAHVNTHTRCSHHNRDESILLLLMENSCFSISSMRFASCAQRCEWRPPPRPVLLHSLPMVQFPFLLLHRLDGCICLSFMAVHLHPRKV